MSERRWRVTSTSYVIDTHFLRLRKDRIELPDGTVVEDYFVRESRGFAVIFALTDDERVVLVRQYKHGIGKVLLELPAGAIDPGEKPMECALREFTEETGYEAATMEHVRTFVVDPTNSDSLAYLFFARGAKAGAGQSLDVTEDIAVELVTTAQAAELAANGTIDSVVHVAAIYCMLERLGR